MELASEHLRPDEGISWGRSFYFLEGKGAVDKMKRISVVVGLCLAAIFAVSALGASSAFAGEFGVCVKAAKSGKKYTGKYNDKGCTQVNAKSEGKYEWEPYPATKSGVKWGYTDKTKTATLEGSAGSITCTASTSVGKVTGVKTDEDVVTFTGCILSVTKESCQNTATKGEIVTNDLETRLIDHGETGFSGKEPAEGEVWSEFVSKSGPEGIQAEWECSGIPFATAGSLSGVIEKADLNKASNKSKTVFSATGGEQDLVTTFFNPLTGKVETGGSKEITTGETKDESKIEIRS